MSRLVDGLARKELVTRDVQAQDRRRVALKLSSSGRKYFHTVMKSVEDRFSEQFSKLDRDQASALRAGLVILGEVIQ
jgi:DNA-binding MarR family transcriptional regulator